MASHGVPRTSGLDRKSQKAKEAEKRKIDAYNKLVEIARSDATQNLYTPEALDNTSNLLNANPEYYTIWNQRRRILQHLFKEVKAPGPSDDGPEQTEPEQTPSQDDAANKEQQRVLELITADFVFIMPLLQMYPKCYWLWNHRLWLLSQTSQLIEAPTALKIWQKELALDNAMLERDARNFHAWDYRRFIIRRLEEQTGKSLVKDEFNFTTKKIYADLSNFSAWHYRSKLIPKMLEIGHAEDDERRKILADEFEFISGAVNTDPYDQSLWFYHQFLINSLQADIPEHEKIVLTLSNHDRLERLEIEINGVKEIESDTDDCKWLYQMLLKYTAMALDIESGNKIVTTTEMRDWLSRLKELDPLREGQWNDLEKSLNL